MKIKDRFSSLCYSSLITSLLLAASAHATPYTWTDVTSGTRDWTVSGNWLDNAPYVSDPANELIFFADNTTNIGNATRNITTNVPTTLAMNTLTLNGKGASSGASSSTNTIGTSASTWTIGDGTTSVVNLNGNFGATAAAGWNYNIVANLTLNQATTIFTGNGSGGFTFSGSIGQSASGYGITKSGTSTLILNGSLNFTGGISLTGGTLQFGNNSAFGGYSGDISLASGTVLRYQSTSNQTLSGSISGGGGVTKSGTGTLTLSDLNTYTGKTVIAPTSGPTAAGTLIVSSFNSVNGGTPLLSSSSLGAPTTVANGTIDLGAGIQAAATLQYSGDSATGETTDRVINIVFNGNSTTRTLNASGSGLLRFTSAFTSNATANNTFILGGTGSGQIDQGLPQLSSLGLDKRGTGTWTLGGSGLFTGPTLITAGTLSLSSATALQNSPFDTASVVGGASAGLKIATTTLTLGGLTGSNALESRFTTALGGPSEATANGGYSGLTGLTLNTGAGASHTYSGVIGEGATGMTLTKSGLGTQFFNGAQSYTGLTTVSAGTLAGNGSFAGPVSMGTASSVVISPGASAGAIGTITIADNSASAFTLNGNRLLVDLPNSGACDLIDVTGTMIINGTNTVLPTFPAAGVTAGTYNLISYAATSGAGSLVFPNGLTTLGNATLAVGTTEATLTIGAGGLNHSVWSGASGTWDDSATNWTRDGVATQAYVDGDFVTFNDAGTTLTVTSTATVSPAMVTFSNTTAKTYVINATIGGTGTPVVKSGNGTVTLGGTNTYTGGTVISAGQLNTTSDANLGTGGGLIVNGSASWSMGAAVTVNYNRNLTVNEGATLTLLSGNAEKRIMGSLEGSGTVFANHSTSFRFDNASNFTGSFRANTANSASYGLDLYSLRDEAGDGTISLENGSFRWFGSGGTKTFNDRQFILGGNGSIFNRSPDNSAILIITNLGQSGSGTRTLTLGGNASAAGTFSGNIGNNGGSAVTVSKVESNTWTLSGSNSYSGGTSLSAGTLNINSATALGTGALTIAANSTFNNTSGSAITLTNNNAFTLSGGSPTFTGTNDLNLGSGTVTISGANRTITVTNAGSVLAMGGVTADNSGNRSLTKDGLGTLAINGAAGSWTGGVNISRGTLRAGNATALGSGPIAFNSGANVGTLQNTTGGQINLPATAVNIGGNGGTIATISGTTGNNWTLGTLTNTQSGNAVLTVDTVNASFAAVNLSNSATNRTLTIQGSGNVTVTGAVANGGSSTASALTKSGSGTLTLEGTNTYSGATNINNGTLALVGASMSSAITVATGASLGFTLGSPASSTSTVNLTNGTVKITGTPTLPSYTLMTTTGITGTPTLDSPIPGYALEVDGTTLELNAVGGDMIPPTLVSISDNVSGGPVDVGATVIYTVTFDEDIDDTTVTTADFNNNGTAGITVNSVTETSATSGVFTVSVTANSPGSLKLRIPTGAVIKDVAGNDLVVPVEDDTTITVRTLFETWANDTYVPPLTQKLPGDDQDGDGFNNLMEYAFGTEPTVAASGSIEWVNGGAVTTPGQPVAVNFANPGVDFRAVFGRRKDHVAAGLTYTVEFSAGLDVWVASGATPTVLTGAGGLNPSEIEAVSVPYPLLIDVGGNNFKKPTFFRVKIED